MCPETEAFNEYEQKKLTSVGLVNKRQCNFDWTEEVKNVSGSNENFSDDETDYAAIRGQMDR